MPVPAQTPKLTNTEWLVFISDNAFIQYMMYTYETLNPIIEK